MSRLLPLPPCALLRGDSHMAAVCPAGPLPTMQTFVLRTGAAMAESARTGGTGDVGATAAAAATEAAAAAAARRRPRRRST